MRAFTRDPVECALHRDSTCSKEMARAGVPDSGPLRALRALLLRRRAGAGRIAFRAGRARPVLLHLFLVHFLGARAGGRSLVRSRRRVLRLLRCAGSSHQERNRRNGQEGRCK